MANIFGARDSCVISEVNSKAKMLEKLYGAAIVYCNIRWLPKGKCCNVFDD